MLEVVYPIFLVSIGAHCVTFYINWYYSFGWVQHVMFIAAFVSTVVGMEHITRWQHHKLWHDGFLWFIHKTHHSKDKHHGFEWNDALGIGIALPVISFSLCGYFLSINHQFRLACLVYIICLGIIIYGFATILIHDGLYHKRFWTPRFLQQKFIKKIYQAHHGHHARKTEGISDDHYPPYGFFLAPREVLLAKQNQEVTTPLWIYTLFFISIGYTLYTSLQ